MKLGEIIKNYRENHHLSLADFANRTGYSKTYISMLENNYNPSTKKPIIPTPVTLKKCANAMNFSLNELVKKLDPDQSIELIYAEDLSPEEQSLVSDFRGLNQEGKNIVTSTAKGLVSNPLYAAETATPSPDQDEKENASA